MAVDRIALIHLEVKLKGVAQTIVSLVHGHVATTRLTFRADELPRLCFSVRSGVDRAVHMRWGSRYHLTRRACQQLSRHPLGTVSAIQSKGV